MEVILLSMYLWEVGCVINILLRYTMHCSCGKEQH